MKLVIVALFLATCGCHGYRGHYSYHLDTGAHYYTEVGCHHHHYVQPRYSLPSVVYLNKNSPSYREKRGGDGFLWEASDGHTTVYFSKHGGLYKLTNEYGRWNRPDVRVVICDHY